MQACLFYAGDFDWNPSDSNEFTNEKDLIVGTGAAVYTPFIVPKEEPRHDRPVHQQRHLPDLRVLDPKVRPYEVRRGSP